MTYARGPSPDPEPLPGGQPAGPQALPALTLTESVRAIRDGSLSPADLVTEALASLHRWQPVTTAVSQVWPEEALDAARAVRADPHLPLAGIPVLVKENMDVAGHKSTACCNAFRDRRASEDAQVVASLRAAGAIVIGKANMHELAASATGHISACGAMHNPWDPARLAGGSSGGSAAAVAARSVPLTARHRYRRVDPRSLVVLRGRRAEANPGPAVHARDHATRPVPRLRGARRRAVRKISALPSPSWWASQGRSPGCGSRRPGSWWRGRGPGYYAEGIHPDVRSALNSAAEVLAGGRADAHGRALPEWRTRSAPGGTSRGRSSWTATPIST